MSKLDDGEQRMRADVLCAVRSSSLLGQLERVHSLARDVRSPWPMTRRKDKNEEEQQRAPNDETHLSFSL